MEKNEIKVVTEISGNPTVEEVLSALSSKGLANAATQFGITAAELYKVINKYDLKLPQSPVARRKAKQRETGQPIARQLVGLFGSIILVVGVFTPIGSIILSVRVFMPILGVPIGNLNYFQNGKGDGMIVLILAVISLVLVLIKAYEWLWFTGLGSMGVLLFTFINFQSRMSQAIANMKSELAGNRDLADLADLADMAILSVQLQWGWALLIVGAALVIASAAMKGKTQQNR